MSKKNNGKELMEDVIYHAKVLLQSNGYDGAADTIENGTSPVHKKSVCGAVECRKCGKIQRWKERCEKCNEPFGWGGRPKEVRAKKTWTEHYEIKIVKVKSNPTFERIE